MSDRALLCAFRHKERESTLSTGLSPIHTEPKPHELAVFGRQATEMPSTDRLRDYRRKRQPGKTPEPAGKAEKGREGPERPDLRHSAPPGEGAPLRPAPRARRRTRELGRAERHAARAGQQHLAVHVEDHPLEYAAFEGEIPKGEYGAGTVEIWDRSTYELLEEKKNGGLTFRLDGERLQGTWASSGASLRPGEELARPPQARRGRQAVGIRHDRPYRPMLATPSRSSRGEGWLFEPKWDGYRALAYVRGGEVELQSRTGKSDFTKRFDAIARALPRGPHARLRTRR